MQKVMFENWIGKGQSCLKCPKQGIQKGEVSLYHWPPVWLVWIQLYDNWQFLFYFQNRLIQTSQTGGQWYSDTSPLVFLAPRIIISAPSSSLCTKTAWPACTAASSVGRLTRALSVSTTMSGKLRCPIELKEKWKKTFNNL